MARIHFLFKVTTLILACELVSFLVLSFDKRFGEWLVDRKRGPFAAEIAGRTGTDYEKLRREMAVIYHERIVYHPYRWYYPCPNFRGKYVTTDDAGFRIDRSSISEKTDKIAFFGGSTMFSTTTRQEADIPSLLNAKLDRSKVEAMNFGVGGYSSTAELMTFIEVLRRDHIRVAVFYDGVNEYSRYLEKIQDKIDAPCFLTMGYYYPACSVLAMESVIENHKNEMRFACRPYTIRLLIRVANVLRNRIVTVKVNTENEINDKNLADHADRIVKIYLQNMKDINTLANAHGITTVFFWQPDIFTTEGKTFTDYEQGIKSENLFLQRLVPAVRHRIKNCAELKNYFFFDIADTLNGLNSKNHFFDYCHVSEEGNMLITARIEKSLRNVLPSYYWKPSLP